MGHVTSPSKRYPASFKRAGSILGVSIALAAFSNVAAAGCEYVVTNSWGSGFTAAIRITNSTSSVINGWNVSWQYNSNRVTNLWNPNLSGSNPYSASNLSWNGTIQPGQTVEFGFQGVTNSGTVESPTVNGAACTGGTSSSVSSSSVVSSSSSSRSSVSSSSVVSSSSSVVSSSSSSVVSGGGQCNWYGTLYPLCVSTTSGWGYENNRSCISPSTCSAQPAPYGIVGGSSSPSSISSSSVRSSSSSSVVPPSSSSSSSVPSSSCSSVSSSSVVSSSSSSVSVPGTGVFRVNTKGNLTKDGQLLPARCGNWFGLEGRHEPSNDADNPSGAPMELYAGNMWWVNNSQGSGRTIQQTMTELKQQGITMLRLPIAPQTLDANDPQGRSPNLKNHQSIRQSNARQALEDFIKLADQNDIQIFIDIHSCSNYVGWRAGRLDARPPYVDANRVGYDFTREEYSCSATNNPSSVTRIHAYDKQKWLANLREIAGLSAKLGVSNLIGIDVFNEPYDYTWAEWKGMVEEAYQAINEVNPNMLIIVEGISANANTQDGTPDTSVPVPHGSTDLNPNWGENLYEAGANPPNIPKDRLLFSPHTYGPSVFVQRQFMDPAQTECAGLEGDEAAQARCRIVINPTVLEQGWEEHFGYLRELGYGILIGEFGGNMDWPGAKSSQADRNAWSHITTNVDQQWQQAAASYFKRKGINACYWSMNPESADTMGWYLTPWDPVTANDMWGQWTGFDPRKTQLLHNMWGL
nr:cellodextrinase C (CELC) [Cellvibrio japonicus]